MKIRTVAVFLLLTGGLGACASVAPTADPEATLSPRVQAMIDANRRYPRWEDFPPAATDLPDATAIAGRVSAVEGQGSALSADAARIEWVLSDAEGFAREVEARIDRTRVAPATAQTQADVEAFAQSLRDRAAAPPPVDRPLPPTPR